MLVPLQLSSLVPGFLPGRRLDWAVRTGCPSHVFIAFPERQRHLVMLSGKGSLDVRETEAWGSSVTHLRCPAMRGHIGPQAIPTCPEFLK